MKSNKQKLDEYIDNKVKKILKESFGDMAMFSIGCERNGDEINVQQKIHGQIITSKTVPLNDTLYEKLFDYCNQKLGGRNPLKNRN